MRYTTNYNFFRSSKSVNRELHYGDTPPSSKARTFERVEEKSYEKKGYSSEGMIGCLIWRVSEQPVPSQWRNLTVDQNMVFAKLRH